MRLEVLNEALAAPISMPVRHLEQFSNSEAPVEETLQRPPLHPFESNAHRT
jgi:hypothetical protein